VAEIKVANGTKGHNQSMPKSQTMGAVRWVQCWLYLLAVNA